MIAANEICVKIKQNVTDATLQNYVSQYGGIVDPKDYNAPLRWRVIRFPQNILIENIFNTFRNNSMFENVEYNFVGSMETEPNDPFFYKQWYLKNVGYWNGIPGEDINILNAWAITRGNQNVVLAVLDTGIPLDSNYNLSHPDLNDQSRIILGINVTNSNDSIKDNNGHGTHVAGIMAASFNNSVGISGVCPNCKMLAIKVSEPPMGDSLTAAYFRRSIEYLVNWKWSNPYSIIIANLSASVPYTTSGDVYKQMEDAVRLANDNSILLVVSMGNQGIYPKKQIRLPAYFSKKFTNVIAVGSVDNKGIVVYYSNKGSHINVVAPGGNDDAGRIQEEKIFSTLPNYPTAGNDWFYGYKAGTSMAAPIVTGIAGLISSIEEYEPSLIRDIIQQSADDKGPVGFDTIYGYGRVNAFKALKMVKSRPLNCRVIEFNNRPKVIWDHNNENYGEDYNFYIIYKKTLDNEGNVNYQKIGSVGIDTNYFVDYSEFVYNNENQVETRLVTYRVSKAQMDNSGLVLAESALSNRAKIYVKGKTLEKTSLSSNFNFRLFPNPTNNFVKLVFNLPIDDYVSISIYNSIGELIYNVNLGFLQFGEHTYNLNLSYIPSGFYILNFSTSNFRKFEKFIITK